ncbi:MAG: YifB family Mg chelatase-like AAA ATPase [Firmicutes bacterium]|nr:YifB family Mg chelatase-like AAA ATPase [Bacillota bacterium]
MFTVVQGVALRGLQGYRVGVEADLGQGLPSFEIVGLPASSVREAKERVRSAVTNSGFTWPRRRIVVNLTPSDWRKDGTGLDLPIAMAILVASEQIPPLSPEISFLGELALDGGIRSYRGLWTAMISATELGAKYLIVPVGSDLRLPVHLDCEILMAPSLTWAIRSARKEAIYTPPPRVEKLEGEEPSEQVDMNEVAGQDAVKRAIEVAAAGHHHILLTGHPGAGKSMLAERLPTLLPRLTPEQALAVRQIYSVAGLESICPTESPPFRTPHYSGSLQGLLGGGQIPTPGEVSLAHHGVLFLDEFPEFSRASLEALRQPLETRSITLSRSAYHYTFPADFQMVAAMNPCPCGYLNSQSGRECTCEHRQIERYRAKLSGPILDRIDMTVWVDALDMKSILTAPVAQKESSSVIRKRVVAARQFRAERTLHNHDTDGSARTPAQVLSSLSIDQAARTLLLSCADKASLSARSLFKVARVARTIADLSQEANVSTEHVAEAMQYRFYQ